MPDIVVIDPAYGGTANVGGSEWNYAIGPSGLMEKHAVLGVALAAGRRVTNLRYTVRLTREGDVKLGLRSRAALARTLQARVLISIHFNGNDNPAVQGTETFVHFLHSPN
jgi:N-acetylmuramoyl-L-alanine amidase